MPLQKVARFDYGELAPAVEWPADATEEVKEEEQVGIEEWERWVTAAPSYDAWDSAAGDGLMVEMGLMVKVGLMVEVDLMVEVELLVEVDLMVEVWLMVDVELMVEVGIMRHRPGEEVHGRPTASGMAKAKERGRARARARASHIVAIVETVAETTPRKALARAATPCRRAKATSDGRTTPMMLRSHIPLAQRAPGNMFNRLI